MKELTDGDYRILQALAQEEKSFSDLLKVVKKPNLSFREVETAPEAWAY